MKIGLLGYKGFVGSNVLKILQNYYEIICIDKESVIIDKFDILINCAGSVKKFYAEQNPLKDIEINYNLINRIFSLNFDTIIHISSIDAFEPYTVYGKNKVWIESIIQHCFKNWTIIRLTGLVGDGLSKNVVFDMLNNDYVWVTPDSEYNYINIGLLPEVILRHIKTNNNNIIFNFGSSKNITVDKMTQIFNKKIKFGKKIEKYNFIPIDYLETLINVENSEFYIQEFLNKNIK